MFPNAAVAFNAVCVAERTGAGMGAQALPSVAHPGLTEITYGPLIVTNTTALATKPHVHNQRLFCGHSKQS